MMCVWKSLLSLLGGAGMERNKMEPGDWLEAGGRMGAEVKASWTREADTEKQIQEGCIGRLLKIVPVNL